MSSTALKVCIDAGMYLLLLLLMGQPLLKGAPHEWMGSVAGTLWLVHNALNYKWYRAMFKGRYTAMRIAQTTVDLLLLIAGFCCMLSGIWVSQHIFDVGNGRTIELGRFLHLVATAWTFILTSIHLGLHWTKFMGIAKKIPLNYRSGAAPRRFLRIFACFLCAYGAYLLIDRRFWEELFHLIDYQKAYDESKSCLVYLVESAVMSSPFVGAAHYAKKLSLKKIRSRGNTARSGRTPDRRS